MGLRNHRDSAYGRKVRFRRMPKDVDLGSKIHKSKKSVEDDKFNLAICIDCQRYFESLDLVDGVCFECLGEN